MKIIGHRGSRGLAPENTIASIEKAIKHGVDEVEIDIRMTKDRVAVLSHNPTIVDASGAELSIRHTTYAELLRHKSDLAPLDHTIRTIAHRCPLIIEIKPGEKPGKTFEIIQYYLAKGWRLDEFRIASFDPKILAQARKEFPDVSLVINELWSSVRARHLCKQLGTKRISMQQQWLWRGFLRAMHRSGYEISAFTINNPRRAKKWAPYLYGVITDFPDRFEKK